MSPLVAVVLHEPGVGGATTAVLRALPALRRDGWRFCFWAPQPGAAAELLTARGESVAGGPRELRYSLRALCEPPGPWARARGVPAYLRAFDAFLAREQPDVVHANTILTLPEALVARRRGTATMLHVHEMLGAGPRGAAAARLAGLVDGVASVSQACAEPLRRRGVAVQIVTAGIGASSCAARRGADGSRPLVVGTLATVSRRKGSDLFVDAAEQVARGRDDVEFRVVGPLAGGRERAWAQSVVARAQRSGARWSTTDDALGELAGWDVFVLPARRDPFPLVVLEAMAAGLPVVATRVDGVPEQVDAGCGVLVDPGDAGALARAICGLLDDRAGREAMGSAGARRVAHRFTPERHAGELADAYRQTLLAAAIRRS